jgi:hypothetical protein
MLGPDLTAEGPLYQTLCLQNLQGKDKSAHEANDVRSLGARLQSTSHVEVRRVYGPPMTRVAASGTSTNPTQAA